MYRRSYFIDKDIIFSPSLPLYLVTCGFNRHGIFAVRIIYIYVASLRVNAFASASVAFRENMLCFETAFVATFQNEAASLSFFFCVTNPKYPFIMGIIQSIRCLWQPQTLISRWQEEKKWPKNLTLVNVTQSDEKRQRNIITRTEFFVYHLSSWVNPNVTFGNVSFELNIELCLVTMDHRKANK